MAIPAMVSRAVGGKAGAAVLFSSALVALWFAFYGALTFWADGDTFFSYAEQLTQFRIGYYRRAPGYPLVIALSGYPFTGSLAPLLAIQTVFAALTPWLAFKTFAPFERNAGIAAGIVCLASLTPFYFQNTFYHQSTYFFFGFASVALAASFFATGLTRYIYLSLASATFAYFTQAGVPGFLIGCGSAFAVFAFFHDRRRLKHVIAALGIFAAMIVGFSSYQKWSMRQANPKANTSELGSVIFKQAYLSSHLHGGFDVVGRAADELRRDVFNFYASSAFRDDPAKYAASMYAQAGGPENAWNVFGQYKDRTAELVDRIFAKPDPTYFGAIIDLVERGATDDSVFLRVALAYIVQHPLVFLRYAGENFYALTIGRPWTYLGVEFNILPPYRAYHPPLAFYPASLARICVAAEEGPQDLTGCLNAKNGMRPEALHFLTSREVATGVARRFVIGTWHLVYDLRSLLLVSMVITFVAFWRLGGGLRWTIGAFATAYAVNMSVYCIATDPGNVYQMLSIEMSAFVAGPGVYFVLSAIARENAWFAGRKKTVPAFRLGQEFGRNAQGGLPPSRSA